MLTLTDTVEIDCLPEEAYSTLVSFFKSSENYRQWHEDHVLCRWVTGKDFSPGSVLIAEEYLHKKLHRLKFRITGRTSGSYLAYTMLFPYSLICAGGSFRMTMTKRGTVFAASLSFRGGFISRSVFRKHLEVIKKHMSEEGQNIKRLIEES